ncbi:hypothetical protein CTI12_AA211370 [Artemisia annua]|uniref:MRN complex-interacting protein N-terminal domain-containing protein n=1 Tax=Artemisia annua TaxID=35608 RepID=A0A2U1NZ76_ARTAN|nr:hypothetical protein CTI12_AA211370 [Artemisia annua]
MQKVFIAVQCFKCSTMQVKQSQKSSNEKQSVRKVFLQAFMAKDVRKFVQTFNIEDLCEPNVVTELPKPLFKKPKLRDNYSAVGLDCADGAKPRRPVFGKRNVKKKVDYPGYKISFSF